MALSAAPGEAIASLIEGAATGDVTPSEAGEPAKLIDLHLRSVGVHDLDQLHHQAGGEAPMTDSVPTSVAPPVKRLHF
jgi:hypothetical protein